MEHFVPFLLAMIGGVTVVAYRHPGSYRTVFGPVCQMIVAWAMSLTLLATNLGIVEQNATRAFLVSLIVTMCYLAFLFFLHRMLAIGESSEG